jgi:hypothetical protein
MIEQIKQNFIRSPLFKTLIGVFSLVIFSVLSGTFTVEITKNGVLEWNLFFRSVSFYLLLILIILMYFYFRFFYTLEKSIHDFKDDNYCKAYMRKECLPELAKKVNKMIKTGKDSQDVKNILIDLNL